jgi:hypothetical protein
MEGSWADQRPRPSGEVGWRSGQGEVGGPRQEEGRAGRPKATSQVAGLKTRDGSKFKKKFFLNFN